MKQSSFTEVERDNWQNCFKTIVDSFALTEAATLHHRAGAFCAHRKCVSSVSRTNASSTPEPRNFAVVPIFELHVDWTGKKWWNFKCNSTWSGLPWVRLRYLQFSSSHLQNYNIHASCNEQNSVWHDGSAYNIILPWVCELWENNMCTHYYITQSTNIGAPPPDCWHIVHHLHAATQSRYTTSAVRQPLSCAVYAARRPYNVFILTISLVHLRTGTCSSIPPPPLPVWYICRLCAGMRNVIIADKQNFLHHIRLRDVWCVRNVEMSYEFPFCRRKKNVRLDEWVQFDKYHIQCLRVKSASPKCSQQI